MGVILSNIRNSPVPSGYGLSTLSTRLHESCLPRIETGGSGDRSGTTRDADRGNDDRDLDVVDPELGFRRSGFEALLREGRHAAGRALHDLELAETAQTRADRVVTDDNRRANEVAAARDFDFGGEHRSLFERRAGENLRAEVGTDGGVGGDEADDGGWGGGVGLKKDHAGRRGADGGVNEAGEMHDDVRHRQAGLGASDEIDAAFPRHPILNTHGEKLWASVGGPGNRNEE